MNKDETIANNHLFQNSYLLDDTKEEKLTPAENTEYERIKHELLNLLKLRKSAIVAYAAPKGSGKSTIIRKIKNDEKLNYTSIIKSSEIWQYSNPDTAWEDFAVSIIANREREKKKLVTQIHDGAIRIPTVFLIVILSILFVASKFILYSIKEKLNFALEISIDAIGIIVPLIISVVPTSKLIKTLNVSFIFQIESMLLKMLSKKKKKAIIVILEDIERSETGLRLLESMHSFISRNSKTFKRQIIILVPTTKDFIYKHDGIKSIDQLERNTKIFDYILNGWIRNSVNDLDIKTLFDGLKCIDEKLMSTISFLNKQALKEKSLLNIRALKMMLREIDNFYVSHAGTKSEIIALYVSTNYYNFEKGGQDSIRSFLQGDKVLGRNGSYYDYNSCIIKTVFGVESDKQYDYKLGYSEDNTHDIVKDEAERLITITVPKDYKYILLK